jgi:hypothetical protein
MDTIKFVIEQFVDEEAGYRFPVINIYINGQHTVTWSDMKSPWLSGKTPSPWIDEVEAQELDWHPLSYAGLGPFTFEHKQYLSALEEITEEWSNHKA